jgi:hypothetical protein
VPTPPPATPAEEETSRAPSLAKQPPTPARRLPDPEATEAFDLPNDVLDVVMRKLPPKALAAASGTCRAWRDAGEANGMWESHLDEVIGMLPDGGAEDEEDETAKGGAFSFATSPSPPPPRPFRLNRGRVAPSPPQPPPAPRREAPETSASRARRLFKRAATLRKRWADGQYARCDLRKHTWSVECLGAF